MWVYFTKSIMKFSRSWDITTEEVRRRVDKSHIAIKVFIYLNNQLEIIKMSQSFNNIH